MNRVLLTGRIVRDIELSQNSNGNSYTFNTIAIKRDYKETDGSYKSDFIKLNIYGRNADYLAKYGKKGDLVEVVGWWKAETVKKDDGTYENRNECIVIDIKVFTSKKEITADDLTGEINIEPKENIEDDLPF